LRSLCRPGMPCKFIGLQDALRKIVEVIELYVFVMPGTDAFYKKVTDPLELLTTQLTEQPCCIYPSTVLVDEPVRCKYLSSVPSPLQTKHVVHCIAVFIGVAKLTESALNTLRLTIVDLAKLQIQRREESGSQEEIDELAEDSTRLGKACSNIHALISKFERPIEKLALTLQNMLLRSVCKQVNNLYGPDYMQLHVNRQGRRLCQSSFRMTDDLLETVVSDLEQKETLEHTLRVRKLRQLQMNVGQLGDLLRSVPVCEDAGRGRGSGKGEGGDGTGGDNQ